MRIWRGEVVGELHGLTAELARGSEQAVELRCYEFHCGQAVAPVEIGRREVVGKVSEGEAELLVVLVWAELLVVLVWAELLWNGGSIAR